MGQGGVQLAGDKEALRRGRQRVSERRELEDCEGRAGEEGDRCGKLYGRRRERNVGGVRGGRR